MVSPKELVSALISKVMDLFNLSKFDVVVTTNLEKEYDKGLIKAEKELNMNFVSDTNTKNNLKELGSQGLKDFSEEMENKLKAELLRGITDGESNAQIKKRLIGFFGNKPNQSKFNWDDRLDAILRTESNRAYNLGVINGAEQAGVKVEKWLLVTEDQRTSAICTAEDAKYGSPEKAIPLDQMFKVVVGNKTYTKKQPPLHVNCRSVLQLEVVE